MNIKIFQALSDMIAETTGRREKEYADFLAFYRALVETIPTKVSQAFGKMEVSATGGKGYGLLLTAADYLYWKTAIEQNGLRFAKGPRGVQLDMLDRFVSKAEDSGLEPKERKRLLALLDEAQGAAA